ncbi:carboxypeptidase-like regulatory domain-containing protein [Flavobacteriaceae bacterium]|nr:carboxypeptidase-like regulatory domain-containing protein [Flavobacteriaceae bacterium]
MKNTVFLCLSLFLTSFVFGQERNPIKGKLLYKNTNVVAANVVNNTDQTNTITDQDGEFEIDVAVGDEVIFSSLEFRIRSVIITEEIIKKNRLVVTVNENINELKEVVVTSEDIEKFLDLKEDEFKGFDYERDKSSRINNRLTDDRLVTNGIDFVNIARLIGKAFSGKTNEEQMKMKPSEILPYVFDSVFFEEDLNLKTDQVVGYLEYIDSQMKSSELLKQSKQFELIDYLINKSRDYKEVLSR